MPMPNMFSVVVKEINTGMFYLLVKEYGGLLISLTSDGRIFLHHHIITVRLFGDWLPVCFNTVFTK